MIYEKLLSVRSLMSVDVDVDRRRGRVDLSP